MDCKFKDKATASAWSHHHQQQHRQDEEDWAGPYISQSLSNPLRRTSSDTRIGVIYNREFVRMMDDKTAATNQGQGESARAGGGERSGVDWMERDEQAADLNHEDEELPKLTEEEILDLKFEACIQKHQHTPLKIFPKLFNCLQHSYYHTQIVMYYVSVILIGVPMTIMCGGVTEISVFCRVWVWVLVVKLVVFWLQSCAPVVVQPLRLLCIPVVDVCGRRFRQIRVRRTLSGMEKAPLRIQKV